MKKIKIAGCIVVIAFMFVIYENIMAFRDGIVGLTKKNGNETGCVCHTFKPNDSVSVRITGPSVVPVNDTAIYVLSIANGPGVAGGCDISASLGDVYETPLDTSLRRAESFPGSGYELTHRYPKLFSGDTLKFFFKYIAPSTPNVIDTLFANGNSANNDTTSDNDLWNYADNFLVSISPVGINENNSIADDFVLNQNYPNPFNPETKISFNLRNSGEISLEIYDISGKEIARLIDNKFYTQGSYSITFNAGQYGINSGVYFYKMTTGGKYQSVKKMMFIK